MSDSIDKNNIILSNHEFLTALFGDQWIAGQSAWVCSFAEDPHDGHWKGRPWIGKAENDPFPEGALSQNCFFSLASFKSDKKGRNEGNAAAVVAVMLDDIGTKASGDNLPQPTWVIETSPGNSQYGYALNPVITDMPMAKIFFQKLAKDQGITDTGGQNVVRYARLPNGQNTKSEHVRDDGTYPSTRLVQWNPDVRYAPEDLAKLLGLDLTARKSKRATAEDEADIFQDSLPENPVVTQLKNLKFYKYEKSLRTHEITCPWVGDHTGQLDDGSVYFEPTEEYPIGGFKCHHGHCSHRSVRDLCKFLGVDGAAASNRPTIKAIGGELHRIVARSEELLHRAGYYQNGGIIVSIQSQDTSQGEVLSTVPLDSTTATVELTRIAAWTRYDSREGGWVNMDAPPKYAAAVVSPTQRRHLRSVLALSRQPFLRPDRTVCREAGYDPASQIFAAFDPRQFPSIPDCPSKADAEAAVHTLLELLQETPFKTSADRSAALAMFLTAAIRPALPTAPGFLINAHSSGSGKSYLQDMAGSFATSETQLPSAAFMAQDEELRKELLAKLLEAPAVIKWDEMKTDLLPVKALLSALSSERIEGRRLGHSQIIKVSTRCLMLFAGNNVLPVDDMTRRVITIHIDPQMEDPATREFKRDVLSDLRKERGRYIMAALTVIMAWETAGRPYASEAKVAINGFELWSDLCRQPLLWLGYPDPASNLFNALKSDPAKDELARVMAAWDDAFGASPTSVKQAIKKSESDNVLRDTLLEVAEGRPNEIDRKKLGYYLKKSLGRPIKGRLFELDTIFSRSANTYRLSRFGSTARHKSLDEIAQEKLTNHGKDPLPSYSSYASDSGDSERVDDGSRKSRTSRNLTDVVGDLSESVKIQTLSSSNTSLGFLTVDEFLV
jgi:hypothetical protein